MQSIPMHGFDVQLPLPSHMPPGHAVVLGAFGYEQTPAEQVPALVLHGLFDMPQRIPEHGSEAQVPLPSQVPPGQNEPAETLGYEHTPAVHVPELSLQ